MGGTYQTHVHCYHLVHVGNEWGLFCYGCGRAAPPGETIPFRSIVDYDRLAVVELLEEAKYGHGHKQDNQPL
jgi:hypothetical protein